MYGTLAVIRKTNYYFMLGKLTDNQIDDLLNAQRVGRIGCTRKNKIYIVPVTFVYHEGYVYAHSKEGLKVNICAKIPRSVFR